MLLRSLKGGHGLAGGGGLLLGLMIGGGIIPYAVGLVTGAVVVAVAILGLKLGHRLVRRLDRALPDRLSPDDFGRLISDDPDYLAGVEAGMRAARRSAGHEDGKMVEGDRMLGRAGV